MGAPRKFAVVGPDGRRISLHHTEAEATAAAEYINQHGVAVASALHANRLVRGPRKANIRPSVPDLMTTAQVAAMLGVHPNTLRYWRKRGVGPVEDERRGTKNITRFWRRETVEEWLPAGWIVDTPPPQADELPGWRSIVEGW